MRAALSQLRGAFALGFIFAGEDDLMIGARKGPPLAVGYGDGEMYLGSDAIALGPFTDTISYLEDGDWVVLNAQGRDHLRQGQRHRAARGDQALGAATSLVDKANYRHFMAKEIHEQPEVVGHTLARYVDMATERVAHAGQAAVRLQGHPARLDHRLRHRELCRLRRQILVRAVCARLPVELDVASEFRYREAPLRKGDLAIFISQSGETADTLAALRYAKEQGHAHALGRQRADLDDCARERDRAADTGRSRDRRRLDQGVHLPADGAGAAGDRRRQGARRAVEADESKLVHGLVEVPRLMSEALTLGAADREAGARHRRSRTTCSISAAAPAIRWRWKSALKLKEISYIHAEGYAAGELKHGPIALIDENMPVVVIAPYDRVFEKTVSNMQEVAARGGKIILMTDAKGRGGGDHRLAGHHRDAGHGRDLHAAGLRRSGAAARLSHRRGDGHRRRSAAKPGQIGHGEQAGEAARLSQAAGLAAWRRQVASPALAKSR